MKLAYRKPRGFAEAQSVSQRMFADGAFHRR